MSVEDLPHVDEHAVEVAAPPAAVSAALLAVLHGTFGSSAARAVAVGLRVRGEGWAVTGAAA